MQSGGIVDGEASWLDSNGKYESRQCGGDLGYKSSTLASWLLAGTFQGLEKQLMTAIKFSLSLAGIWFRLRVLKSRLMMQAHQFVNRWLVKDCGHYCRWVYPLGFVPEAGCPIHDQD